MKRFLEFKFGLFQNFRSELSVIFKEKTKTYWKMKNEDILLDTFYLFLMKSVLLCFHHNTTELKICITDLWTNQTDMHPKIYHQCTEHHIISCILSLRDLLSGQMNTMLVFVQGISLRELCGYELMTLSYF